MAHRPVQLACLVALLAVSTSSKEQSRWSRQISSYTSDISDWVPLTGPIEREAFDREPLPPIKRQAVAEPRILSEPFPGFTRPTGFSQDAFPPRPYYNTPANRQLFLQSVPSAPQNYLTDQGFGQSIRFGLSQPNFPLNQGFISPQFSFDNVPALPPTKPRTQPVLPPTSINSFSKQTLPSPQAKPFLNQSLKPKPDTPKFIDGYRAENISGDYLNSKKKLQPQHKIRFENFDKTPKIETIASKPKSEREEVQLLYVPVESLNRGQFNFRNPQTSNLNTDLYSQNLPKPNPLKQAFSNEVQKPIAKPIDTFSTNQDYFSNYQVLHNDQIPKFSTISPPFSTVPPTTPKPKKLKPHQPPLAIFMVQDSRKGNQLKVGDVLSTLKSANSVAVLDTVNPQNAPKVFIGPSTLKSPENFVKFELPYLSNIENSDKKLRQLPFFVAPLSYNTPNGFAKIPFPSPHVGSVVINSQIRDTASPGLPTYLPRPTPSANIIPNAYTATPQEPKPAPHKPNFSYYSTPAPKTNAPPKNQHLNYYEIEPQTVTGNQPQRVPTANLNAQPKPGSYFLTDVGNQYNPSNYNIQQNDPVNQYNFAKPETSTTPRTTVTTTTTKPPSTYSSQLLETHNPYSINQAFHFSTPLDYHNYYDEYKEPYATVGQVTKGSSTTVTPPSSSSVAPRQEEVSTEKQAYQQQSSPNYLQNYSPEIHYESEITNSRYPNYNTNAPGSSENYGSLNQPEATPLQPANELQYNTNQQVGSFEQAAYNPSSNENLTETIINKISGPGENVLPPNRGYEQYETSFEAENTQYSSSTTSTTTTTTRRPSIRNRGRPRYTTPKAETAEPSSTRASITRRPLRERRPLPSRTRYEPNKISTEKPTRKPLDSSESTTKSTRSRTRGRVQYKPSESDDVFNKRSKGQNSKEQDLAYQRDVLHQNYPVTLMERMSTVDIEAITEPSGFSSTRNLDNNQGEAYDTENAYAHDSASISYFGNTDPKEDVSLHNTDSESQTDNTYVSRFTSTHNDDYIYQSKSSAAPIQTISSYEDINEKQEQESPKPTTPEVISYVTEGTRSSSAEQYLPNYSAKNEYSSTKQEELPTTKEVEITKITSPETHKTATEENIIQTTPSYNRVRVRPGVIRQYHQASSTESSRSKAERKKVQAVTYRPAFDRRRTTMRIEEIEADLKTKQIHSRPDFQDYKHPVYKPEPTTESSITTPISTETTTKRGHFRRRRPNYSTTSTEASSTKKSTYELKNRFRGRRPTEKPTEKYEQPTETTTTTLRSTPHSRYSHRPRLSERYNNKKTSSNGEDSDDQETNYSINRPKYASPDSDQWSPKISGDSFKPYNPNDIIEDAKTSIPEDKSEGVGQDIITARNDYDEILISVTPATNNRAVKKIPDIPPTLEALVEQSKTTKVDSTDSMSTFETMLEEVMKTLEEQDQDEYTNNVMKHKGGEIGEIPPERIITSGEENSSKASLPEAEVTTYPSIGDDAANLDKEQADHKGRRRGYWKKVKVRPVSTEAIEAAESQYYTSTVNRLGEHIESSKVGHEKFGEEKPKVSVTTYKPNFQFIKDFFEDDDESADTMPVVDIAKIDNHPTETKVENLDQHNDNKEITTEKATSPGDVDLGTGSPDPTMIDSMYYSTPTEPTSSESVVSLLDRSDGFSIMDYFFGPSTTDDEHDRKSEQSNNTTAKIEKVTQTPEVITTEQAKTKLTTTENNYIPEEITDVPSEDNDSISNVPEFVDVKKIKNTDDSSLTLIFETSSQSSYMNPANVVSTSMSTEVSHETEICFRGKCIKTNRDIL